MTPTIPGLPGNSVEEEPIQEPGRTAIGSRLDIAAAKKRWEEVLARMEAVLHAAGSHPLLLVEVSREVFRDLFYQELVDADLPAALEALGEAQGKLSAVQAEHAKWLDGASPSTALVKIGGLVGSKGRDDRILNPKEGSNG